MKTIEQIKLEQPIFYQTIYNEFNQNKRNHAYLIEGHDAYQYAEFLVKSLLCQDELLCCDQCRICQQVSENSYIDMIHYNGKEEPIKKGAIEAIQSKLLKTSVEGHGKIYVIESIENSTPEAINSLLKILEEPVEGIYAVFTCENINRVLPTIVSRCQIFRLKPLNMGLMKDSIIEQGTSEEKANILTHISSSSVQMLELSKSESFNDLIIEALNFVEDYYFKKENLALNVQTNLLKKFKDRDSIALFLDLIVLGFKDVLNKNNHIDQIFCDHDFILNCQDEDEALIEKIENILMIKNDLGYNANIALIIDRLVYSI